MKKEIKRLPDSELEIMLAIWQQTPPVLRTDVVKHLDNTKKWTDTTVLTLLSRLVYKGFLAIEKDGKSNLYTPTITKKQYLEIENSSFLSRLHSNSIKSFMTSFVQNTPLSKSDIQELEDILQQMKENKK